VKDHLYLAAAGPHWPRRTLARRARALPSRSDAKRRLRFLGAGRKFALAQAGVYMSLAAKVERRLQGLRQRDGRRPETEADSVRSIFSKRANQSNEKLGYGKDTNTPPQLTKNHRHVLPSDENLLAAPGYKPPTRASNNGHSH